MKNFTRIFKPLFPAALFFVFVGAMNIQSTPARADSFPNNPARVMDKHPKPDPTPTPKPGPRDGGADD